MSFPCRIAGLSPLLLIVVLGACGGNGGPDVTVTPSPTITVTAASTATVTAPPTPTDTAAPMVTVTPPVAPTPSPIATPFPSPEAEAPHAAPIELDPGVESLAEHDFLLAILRPQASHNLDPVALAEEIGITPPPCDALVFYVSWQVLDPFPPTDVDVEVYGTRTGAPGLIGEGPSGQASSGCGEVQLLNNSGISATLEISYLIGELTR